MLSQSAVVNRSDLYLTDAIQVTGELTSSQSSPFDHGLVLAKYSEATPELVSRAIAGALEAKKTWSRTTLHDRASILYRAAGLIETTYKYRMMAATMLGQGKNAYQADIDCVAEVGKRGILAIARG